MSIDTGAILIVGVDYETLNKYSEYEEAMVAGDYEPADMYDWVEELGLSSASPYYDSDYDSRVFGITVISTDWTYKEIAEELLVIYIANAHKRFTEATGLVGSLYISANVW